MPSNIQDAATGGSNLFNNSINERRRNLAYNALRSAYGDVAGDPAAFGSLEATQQSHDNAPAKAESLRLGNETSQQTLDQNAKLDPLKVQEAQNTVNKGTGDIDAEAQKRKAQALLNGALFVKGAIGRGEDPGAAFDQIAPMLALDPAHATQMRANLVANPKSVDDFIAALQDRDKKTPDPSAIQEDKYFQSLSPQGQARYLTVKRANQTSVADVEGGKEVIIRNPDGTVRRVPLSTLADEAGAAQTIADARGTGAAEGKVRGETNAEDLPLSEVGKIKAKTALDASHQSFDVADQTINKALGDTGWLSAGPLSALPDFANPSAANLRGELTTVTSKVVLDTIQEMKSLSKTGATGFGQLSDREGALIQSRLGAVLQATTPKRLKSALTDLQNQLVTSRKRLDDAYNAEQKVRAPKAAKLSDDELLKLYTK